MMSRVKQAFENSFRFMCLQLLMEAYNYAIKNQTINLSWEENDITAELHKHIDENQSRLEWNGGIATNVEHHIPNDSSDKEKGYAAKYPRIDLRYVTIYSAKEYKYFFEAKNLKQSCSKLRRRYISTGIDNFVKGKYSNGSLIGYLLEGEVKTAVAGINTLLEKDGRSAEIMKKKCCQTCNDSYESTHTPIGILSHYILDFKKSLKV